MYLVVIFPYTKSRQLQKAILPDLATAMSSFISLATGRVGWQDLDNFEQTILFMWYGIESILPQIIIHERNFTVNREWKSFNENSSSTQQRIYMEIDV